MVNADFAGLRFILSCGNRDARANDRLPVKQCTQIALDEPTAIAAATPIRFVEPIIFVVVVNFGKWHQIVMEIYIP